MQDAAVPLQTDSTPVSCPARVSKANTKKNELFLLPTKRCCFVNLLALLLCLLLLLLLLLLWWIHLQHLVLRFFLLRFRRASLKLCFTSIPLPITRVHCESV